MPAMPQRAAQGTLILATGILLSRLLGFMRDMLLAHLLGAAADPFLVAFRVPNFFRRLLAEGSLGMAHGVEIARKLLMQGEAAALEFSRAVCLRLLLFSVLATLVLECAAFPLCFLLAPGLATQSQALEKSAALLRCCLPYLPLCAASAIALAHAAALGNFRPQAWSSLCLNALILSAGGAALLLQAHDSPSAFGLGLSGVELLLCSGIVCGGMAQACLGLRCLRRPKILTGKTARAAAPAEVRAILSHLPASVLGAAPQQLHLLAGSMLASFLAPGGISALYFAERLLELPLGLAGGAVGMGALPRLSSQAARHDLDAFSRTLSGGIRQSAFFALPAAAGLFALALPLADALFGHGAFDSQQVSGTAAALRMYALGLPAMCATRIVLAAVSALGLTHIPLRTACLSLLAFLPVSLGGMLFANGAHAGAAAGLASGLSFGAWINLLLLSRHVRAAGISRPLRGAKGALAAYTVGALSMAAVLSLVNARHTLPAGSLVLLTGGCAALWIGGFYAFNNTDARSLVDVLRGLRHTDKEDHE